MERSTFLTPLEVAELSGIRQGETINGRKFTREELQINWLRSEGIPFIENARKRPIIARSVIEGGFRPLSSAQTKQKPAWAPNAVLRRS